MGDSSSPRSSKIPAVGPFCQNPENQAAEVGLPAPHPGPAAIVVTDVDSSLAFEALAMPGTVILAYTPPGKAASAQHGQRRGGDGVVLKGFFEFF